LPSHNTNAFYPVYKKKDPSLKNPGSTTIPYPHYGIAKGLPAAYLYLSVKNHSPLNLLMSTSTPAFHVSGFSGAKGKGDVFIASRKDAG
jgi:hypothetical protein